MKNATETVRVLLVDNDQSFNLKVRHTLQQEDGIEVVGECISAEEALSEMETLCPNIVLMDIQLPGMDGLEACRHFTESDYTCDVIMFGTEQEYVNAALKAGATWYFPKEINQQELALVFRMTSKWQSLKANMDTGFYSIQQIEAMIIEHLTKLDIGEKTGDEEKLEWLLPEGDGSKKLKEVTLRISLPHSASQLLRFFHRIEESLQSSITETVGSWNDTRITLKLTRPALLPGILDKIARMPEVEKVSEVLAKNEMLVTLSEQPEIPAVVEKPDQYVSLPELSRQMVGAAVS